LERQSSPGRSSVPASFRIRAILNKAINRQGFWQGMTDNCARGQNR
jgi:hypothetical protein